MSLQDLAEYTRVAKYAKYLPEQKRRELWPEQVKRMMDMHRQKYADKLGVLEPYIAEAEEALLEKRVIGSQRALQFGGTPIFKHNGRIYNCSATYIDRPRAFSEFVVLGLQGVGIGFSVQQHHVDKLPSISKRKTYVTEYKIDDSIEGWADAIGVLLSTYFDKDQQFPEYHGKGVVKFNYDAIRPAGSKISGGYKAPGPDGLRMAINKITEVFENCLDQGLAKLRPIDAYDILMHASNAIYSGGIRRIACMCLFDLSDEKMMKAKTGDWFVKNPQRARSNNSVILVKDQVTKEQFSSIMNNTKQFGEPGFVWVADRDQAVNPCCFHGDTLIDTSTGKMKISDLAASMNSVQSVEALIEAISYDTATNKIVLKKIVAARKTRENAKMVRIVTTNGKELRVTSDHMIYTTNSGWKRSEDLLLDDQLISWSAEALDQYVKSDCVMAVEPDENADVYDIEVEGTHTLFANGILAHNCEIGFYCRDDETGETGFTFCNLSEINAAKCQDEETFLSAARVATIIGTLQAGYTDFKYLTPTSKKLADKEALLGVSITGIMDNPDISLNSELLEKASQIVKSVNEEVAAIIGISPSARRNCCKPSGCEIPTTRIRTNQGVMTAAEIFEHFGYNCLDYDSNNDTWLEVSKSDLRVYNENNEEDEISKLFVNGYDDVYEFTTEDGSVHTFTAQHKFKVKNYGWKKVSDLELYDVIESFNESSKSEVGRIIFAPINVGKQFTVDFEVKNTHTYQLENGIVSHNSASAMLGVSSGIHPQHSKRYIRRVQANILEEPLKYFRSVNPHAIEKSVWDPNNVTDVISFICEVPSESSIFKNDVSAIDLLKSVKLLQTHWVKPGTSPERGLKEWLTHNVSNTITVRDDEWDEVEDFIYENRDSFCGISLLPHSGDKDYPQAPFTTVYTPSEIIEMYGDAAIIASGVIEKALNAFDGDLWKACDCVLGFGEPVTPKQVKDKIREDFKIGNGNAEYWKNLGLSPDSPADLVAAWLKHSNKNYAEKHTWISKATKFAEKYFSGDVRKMTYCLKDVYNWKHWIDLKREWREVDWSKFCEESDNVEFEQTVACAGGACSLI